VLVAAWCGDDCGAGSDAKDDCKYGPWTKDADGIVTLTLDDPDQRATP